MRCNVVQRRLLESQDPSRPAAEVLHHLAVCGLCREWQRRIVHIERNVLLLPVPESAAPADLLARGQPAGNGRSAAVPPRRGVGGARSRAAVLRVALGAAAAVLLALSWWALQPRPARPTSGQPKKEPFVRDPLVAQLVNHDVQLADAKNVGERIQLLARLADDLRAETEQVGNVARTEDLVKLADLYGKVVREGIVRRAEGLERKQRTGVLDPIADQLERAGNRAQQLSVQYPSASEPLLAMAAASRKGKDRLRDLIRGKT